MIFQGLFNILDLYFDEIDLFYRAIDRYFQNELKVFFGEEALKSESVFPEYKVKYEENSISNNGLVWNKLSISKETAPDDEENFKDQLRNIFDESSENPRVLRKQCRLLRNKNREEWEVKKKQLDNVIGEIKKKRIERRRKRSLFKRKKILEITEETEKAFLAFLEKELLDLGFTLEEIENKFSDPFLKISEKETYTVKSTIDLYKKKIAPIVYEIFLEKVVEYLVDKDVAPVLLNLKSKGFLPIEFVTELRNLKTILDKSRKTDNLRKYSNIRDEIIHKFCDNKSKIESLEDLENPKDKLQLLYLIYRIIDFFHIEEIFDFSHLKTYLREKIDEWLIDVPLITLKNPDIYFCGIYLAKHLNIEIDEKKVKNFLLDLHEEATDEFESPLIEASDGTYYFVKSMVMVDLWLTNEQVEELVKANPEFFDSSYLKNLETSQLVIILKILNMFELYHSIDPEKISAIIEEIKLRVSSEGIKQYRDGFISSEANYYVLFFSYMLNNFEDLISSNMLHFIIDRIYRNLEILNFSQDTNYDLVSEIFYSVESLKLFNCVETKQMIINLANYLFPEEVVDKVLESEDIARTTTKFRHFKVNRITGETIY